MCLRELMPYLLKKVSCSLDLGPLVPLQEFGEIGVPDIIHIRPFKQRDALLVSFECLLKIIVLLQNDDLY